MSTPKTKVIESFRNRIDRLLEEDPVTRRDRAICAAKGWDYPDYRKKRRKR